MSDEEYEERDEEYVEEEGEERDEDASGSAEEDDEEREEGGTAVGQEEDPPAAEEEAAPVNEDDDGPPLILEKEWEGFIRIKVPTAFVLPPPPPPSVGDDTLPLPMDETAMGGGEDSEGDDSPRGNARQEEEMDEEDDGREGDEEAEEQEKEYASAPKVPFAAIKHPELRDARIYFQMDPKLDRTMPPWMRYVLNNEPHFFDTIMDGKKVERPEDRAAAIALKKKLRAKEAKRLAKEAKRRKKKKFVEEEVEEEEVEPVPKEEIEYDEDGHVAISHPFEGNTRFRFIQLTKTRPANPRFNLPEILVDEDELVFIAVAMDATELEAEETAWENDGPASLVPPPTGRAAAFLPAEVVTTVSKLHPPRDVGGARTPGQEGGNDGSEGEGEEREGDEEDDDEGGYDGGRMRSSLSVTGQVLDEEGEEEEEEEGDGGAPKKANLELRMDVMTLAALFCPRAFERGLMRHEALPNMALTAAWLEIYAEAVGGTSTNPILPDEFHNMQSNIVEGSTKALATKKASPPKSAGDGIDGENNNGEDEEEPEAAAAFDDNQPPPMIPYVVRGEDGQYTIPKPTMDLSWTFIKELHFPCMREELRALRRAVGAQLLPSVPIQPSDVCSTPEMTLSYLDYLASIPRSALSSWTKPKLEDMPEEEIEDASEIALDPTSEEHLERPLSYMLGTILLDLRRRQVRKAAGKRDMRLGAFAVHKQALTSKFMESNTTLDPLISARYAVNAIAEEAEQEIKNRHLATKTDFLHSWRTAAEESSNSPNATTPPAAPTATNDWDDVPSYWPVSLRLYDSDLVALACAKYGALETFQEVLRIKIEQVTPTRLVDDTVGTYHLLLQLLPQLSEPCAVYLLHYAANCVPVTPILTSRSLLIHFDMLDTLAQIDPRISAEEAGVEPSAFTTIDGLTTKSATLPREIARNFWQRWYQEDAFMSELKSRAPSVFDEVQYEATKFDGLLDAIANHTITPQEMDAKVQLSSSSNDAESQRGDTMQTRDVFNPVVMYTAVRARNIDVIVHLATRYGVITAQETRDAAPASVMELLIEDDARRNEETSSKPLAARTTEDLLATQEERAEGVLEILLALVENGMPMSKEVFRRGVKGYVSTLQDTFGKSKKLTQLIKRLNQRERERGTDPAQKFGILRYVPEHPKLASSPSKRVAMRYEAAKEE